MQAIALSIPGLFVSLALIGSFEASDRQSASALVVAVAVSLAFALCMLGTVIWGVTGGAVAYSLSHLGLAGLLAVRWTRCQPATQRVVLRPS